MVYIRKPAGSGGRGDGHRSVGGVPPRLIDAFGESLTMEQWAEKSGIHRGTIAYRLRNGWAPEDAVTVPPHVHNRAVQVDGETRFDLDCHGDFGSKEHRSWCHLIERCHNPKDKSFHRYGGRGIEVCSEWRGAGGYSRFLSDVGRAPTDKHSIERIDNEGRYEPGNVKWATATEQARNRRSGKMVEAFGRSQCPAAWAEEVGIAYGTLQRRLAKGWDVEIALTAPLDKTGAAARKARWG